MQTQDSENYNIDSTPKPGMPVRYCGALTAAAAALVLGACASQPTDYASAPATNMQVKTDSGPILVQQFANTACDPHPQGPRVAMVWPDSLDDEVESETAAIPADESLVLSFSNVSMRSYGKVADCTISVKMTPQSDVSYRALYSTQDNKCALAILQFTQDASSPVAAEYTPLGEACYDDTRIAEPLEISVAQ